MSLASLLRPPKSAQLSLLLLESDADVRTVLTPRLHRIRQAPVRIVPALNDLSKARRPDAKLHLDSYDMLLQRSIFSAPQCVQSLGVSRGSPVHKTVCVKPRTLLSILSNALRTSFLKCFGSCAKMGFRFMASMATS